MYWKDRVRDLTPEEEKLIRDYVYDCCGEGDEKTAEYLFQKILKGPEVKMDFLDFAKEGEKMDSGAIWSYIVYD